MPPGYQNQKPNSKQREDVSREKNGASQSQDQSATPTAATGGKSKQNKGNKISNVVTKFSFATKGGIAAHNPYKVN